MKCFFCRIITRVSRNVNTSLPTLFTEDKYFYLTNSEYTEYSSYIYFVLENNKINLRYSEVSYYLTNTDPYDYPDSAFKNCSFITLPLYGAQTFSTPTKYYYNVSISSSYNYTIISYSNYYKEGLSGYLYVVSDYNDLLPKVQMTEVSRNKRYSLPTIDAIYPQVLFVLKKQIMIIKI